MHRSYITRGGSSYKLTLPGGSNYIKKTLRADPTTFLHDIGSAEHPTGSGNKILYSNLF